MKKKRRAQSTMEYTLLFAGLTLAILYGISQWVTPQSEKQMDASGSAMQRSVSEYRGAMGVEEADGD